MVYRCSTILPCRHPEANRTLKPKIMVCLICSLDATILIFETDLTLTVNRCRHLQTSYMPCPDSLLRSLDPHFLFRAKNIS